MMMNGRGIITPQSQAVVTQGIAMAPTRHQSHSVALVDKKPAKPAANAPCPNNDNVHFSFYDRPQSIDAPPEDRADVLLLTRAPQEIRGYRLCVRQQFFV